MFLAWEVVKMENNGIKKKFKNIKKFVVVELLYYYFCSFYEANI